MEFQNISDSYFYKKLINSLPWIFYLYEKVGNKILLRKWNANHVKYLGYSNEKLLNINGAEFFTKPEFKTVTKGIEKYLVKILLKLRLK